MDAMQVLLQRQEAERSKLAREMEQVQRLPLVPQSIHAFKKEAWLTYRAERGEYRLSEPMPLAYAVAVLRTYEAWEHGNGLEVAEHWRNGCVSVQPAELVEARYKDRGTLDGESVIELCSENAGNVRQCLIAHVQDKRDGQWYRIRIELAGWFPAVATRCMVVSVQSLVRCISEGRFGRESLYEFSTLPIAGTFHRKWSTGDAQRHYHVSHYWPTFEGFLEWAEEQVQKQIERAA